MTTRKDSPPFDPKQLLVRANGGGHVTIYRANQNIYSQGDAADSVFYIHSGKVKVVVLSEQGKEAVIAIPGAGAFFGEGCMLGQPRRLATVTTMTECEIAKIAVADIV